MLFTLLCVFGIYQTIHKKANLLYKRTDLMENLRNIELIKMTKGCAEVRNSATIEGIYMKIFKKIAQSDVSAQFDQKKIFSLEPAWAPNSLHYLGKFIVANSDLDVDKIKMLGDIVLAIFHDNFLNDLAQNGLYFVVMRDLFHHVVQTEHRDKIAKLLTDFAIAFFVNRPTTREMQTETVNCLASKYDPENMVDKRFWYVKERFYDLFESHFKVPRVREMLSDELRLRSVDPPTTYFDFLPCRPF
eukprot:NODE_366_length_8705_cov_0.466070.p4 type:complete len:245 gc:universal NODE_366_length_8705_cov_0.466070:7824-7090(-)